MKHQSMSVRDLEKQSMRIREWVLRSIAEAGSGHTGGSLGLADVFAVLYFQILRHRPEDPSWAHRDRLVLSIGHVAPVLYASLALSGYFPEEELLTLRKLGSRLQGHPGRDHGLPGVELSAGSLGQGLSVSVGMALSAKHLNTDWRGYSIHGDGELQEGAIWEAAMSAAHHKLDNLVAIVDRNHVQIDGYTKEVMEIEPLEDKFRAFGWEVLHCDGHDHAHIRSTLQNAPITPGVPTVVIAKTNMGKGVPHIENDYRWHGKPLPKKELESFINALYHG